MMSTAMEPLRSSPEFIHIVSNFENPLIGVAVGAIDVYKRQVVSFWRFVF